MPESQQHGFVWEAEVLRAYGLDPSAARGSYTQPHDIPAAKNTKAPGVNISIKTAGGKSVDMGDVLRIFNETEPGQEPLHLIVLFYDQDGTTKRLRGISQVALTGRRADLFGKVSTEELEAYVASVRAIPAGEPTAEARDAYKAGAAALNARMGALKIRPKVDSKNQRRVQCSFADFPAFCDDLDASCVLYGHQIPRVIESGRRRRAAGATQSA
jgi:hypothetical protein